MPRVGLDREAVLEAAARIADRHGLAGLTMAALAAELKIKPPSLYSHFDGLPAVEDGLTLRGLDGLLATSREVAMGLSGWAAIEALAKAHRRFALAHPGLYAALLRHAEDRSPAIRTAATAYLQVVLSALREYNLDRETCLHVARVLHAALRGFVTLELNNGFGLPIEVEKSFEVLLGILKTGMPTRKDADLTG